MRFLLFLLLAGAAFPQTNPFAPLTADEMRSAVRTLHAAGRLPRGARFSSIALDEPPKEAVLRHAPAPRRALAVIYDPRGDHTWEAVVECAANRIVSFREIPGAQPALTSEDSDFADRVVRADPRFRQAMTERGIFDLDRVYVVSWSAGYFGLPGTESGRIVRALFYYGGAGENFYAHPIEGVCAHVNLTARRILDFLDTGRTAPVSRENFDFTASALGRPRPAPAPLRITQPQGPEFRAVNSEVTWQKWHFRFAMHPREGLVLYNVGFEDGGRLRSILYRASLSEMLVPYGDPSGAWFFRNSFDAGELGLGTAAVTMRPGVDCPQNCSAFDALMADESGTPQTIPGAVALYERDSGLAWKHGDEARRARELVIGYLTQVGNYDYGFDWIFHQDGTLEVRVTLTGIMAVKGVADGAHDPYGHRVARNIAAPHHQHFFTFRLDMDVDGTANRLLEMNTSPLPSGPRNPFGGGFQMEETIVATERQARRNLNLASSRRWIVVNPQVKNAMGEPVGYALLPGESAILLAQPDSWVRKRAGFLDFALWGTACDPAERYAGGDYPNQSRGGDGLPKWSAANRPIDNRDLVIWYSVGVTHNPRPEDWPVMPVQAGGFQLVPWGFFDRNPVLDLPR
jgi:primary-amine oxidase